MPVTGFQGVDLNRVKMEVRTVNPYEVKTKVSGGAKFAAALGGFLGPVSLASSVFFPPMAAVGLAAYGVGHLGSKSVAQQQQQIQLQHQAMAGQGPAQIQYIGYEGSSVVGPQSATAGTRDDVMNVIFLREESFTDMTHSVKSKGL